MTIHYHGTPITPNAELLSIAGAHFCVSHWRPDQDRLCHEIGQTDAWQRRMDEAWREIGQWFKRTPNVHMLRGMQLVGERWPFASVDSTDIGRNHQRVGNTAAKMRARWDAGQCPPRFVCRGEQGELAA